MKYVCFCVQKISLKIYILIILDCVWYTNVKNKLLKIKIKYLNTFSNKKYFEKTV
jgi:hypothetical protein